MATNVMVICTDQNVKFYETESDGKIAVATKYR